MTATTAKEANGKAIAIAKSTSTSTSASASASASISTSNAAIIATSPPGAAPVRVSSSSSPSPSLSPSTLSSEVDTHGDAALIVDTINDTASAPADASAEAEAEAEEEVKPQRTRRLKVDYKRLAGEAYSYDSSEELMYSTSGRTFPTNTYNNDNDHLSDPTNNTHDKNQKGRCINTNDYANKHVPQVLHRSYESSKDILQTVDDGSQLTVQNLVNPNHGLSIHRPILITDTAESIGMKVPRGVSTSASAPTSVPNESTTAAFTNDTGGATDTIMADGGGGTGSGGISGGSSGGSSGDSSGDNSGEGGGGEKGGINTNDTNTKPITIREVGELIGMDHPVSVMDVKTQDEMEGWIISDLVEYFEDEDRLYQIRQQQLLELNLLSTTREMKKHTMTNKYRSSKTRLPSSMPRVLNQISLEFSNTSLRKYTSSPSFVQELDWIDTIWPTNKRYDEDGHDRYPRVQYYCLTSTAGCYTDFHIDFGGTSVWYHVLSGQKIFLLLPPTEQNIALYESWLCSKNQADIFYPDMKEEVKTPNVSTESENGSKEKNDNDQNESFVKQMLEVESCVRVTLEQNQTFIIPTGWIHAVYTPVDSIVLGGNFVHGLDIKGQLDIHCLETRTRVPAKFRFPYFVQLMFYAGKEYYRRLMDPGGIMYKEEVDGIGTLVAALRLWAVNPGDVDREGSIAYVIRECVIEAKNYSIDGTDSTDGFDDIGGIDNIDDLLEALELGVEQLKKNGGEKKALSNTSGTTADIVTSALQQSKNGTNSNLKLKLSLKRSIHSSLHKSVIEGASTDENQIHHGQTSKIFLTTGKINSKSKSKRHKIGDLASKHTVEDDEWLPGQCKKNTKVKKRRQSSKKERCGKLIKKDESNGLIEKKGSMNKSAPRRNNTKEVKKSETKQKKLISGGSARSRLKKKLGM